MSEFERVLSDEEVDDIIKNTTMLLGQSIARSKDFILRVEQAVLEKLSEQEPVAWASSKIVGHYIPNDTRVTAADWFKEGLDVPLYIHPMPCVSPTSDKTACVSENAESDMQRHLEYIKRYQKWRRGEDKTMSEAGLEPKQIGESLDRLVCFVENHVVSNNEMVTPLAQRKIQTLLDKGEYRVIENATVLVSENGHAAIVNKGGAFYWVDNEALAREFDGVGVGVDSHHIADVAQMVPEGWQLIPVEPTMDMIKALLETIVTTSKGGVVNPKTKLTYALAAAPKYTGEK